MRVLLSFILSLIILTSCEKEPEMVNLIAIQKEFNVSIHAATSSTGIVPAIKISSINSIGCQKDDLDIALFKTDTKLSFKINGLLNNTECEDNKVVIENITSFDSDRTNYGVEIWLKDVIMNPGVFKTDGSTYDLRLDTEHGLTVLKKRIKVLPSNRVWGHMAINGDVEESKFFNFLKSITEDPNLDSGDYGLFSINEDDIIFSQEYEFQGDNQAFIFRVDDLETFKSALQEYTENETAPEFTIYSSFGEIF